MSKTKPTKDTNAVNAPAADSLPFGYTPPTVNAPTPPKGWAPSKWLRPREGLKPTIAQTRSAPKAASEMKNAETWVDDFGTQGPDPNDMAEALLVASQWRDAWELATQWQAYCSEQRRIWEDAAFGKVAALKPVFDYAAAHDDKVTSRYPSTTIVVGARSVIARRVAESRKARKKREEALAQSVAPDLPPTRV